MGKGFQNFMSKKDFHPSAWWNLKKVWEAKEKKKLDEQKQEELRIQYEKEQEIMNNKALLGDEKAKLGLSFMYDAPTGMAKREEPKEEPKFEWQRKYNAPREEWAKGNDAIQDQPFGIQVRNVRCVKCHTWGHLNTDRECPMFNMSGNADNPGYANNPSDLLKELEKEKELEKADKKAKKDDDSDNECEPEEVRVEKIDQIQLIADMKEDHGFNFKKNILHNIRSDDVLTTLNSKTTTVDDVQALLKTLSGSARLRVLKKTYGKDSNEYKTELTAIEAAKAAKKAKKDEKKAKKKEKKALSSKKIKQEPESESSSESESEEDVKAKRPQQSNASKSKRRHSDSDDSDDDDRRRPQKSHHSNDRKHKKRRHDSDSDDNGSDYRRKRRRSQCYEKTATRSDRRERRDDRHDEYYRDRRDRRSRRSRSREHRR